MKRILKGVLLSSLLLTIGCKQAPKEPITQSNESIGMVAKIGYLEKVTLNFEGHVKEKTELSDQLFNSFLGDSVVIADYIQVFIDTEGLTLESDSKQNSSSKFNIENNYFLMELEIVAKANQNNVMILQCQNNQSELLTDQFNNYSFKFRKNVTSFFIEAKRQTENIDSEQLTYITIEKMILHLTRKPLKY